MRVLGYRAITTSNQIGKMNPLTPNLPKYNFAYDIWVESPKVDAMNYYIYVSMYIFCTKQIKSWFVVYFISCLYVFCEIVSNVEKHLCIFHSMAECKISSNFKGWKFQDFPIRLKILWQECK